MDRCAFRFCYYHDPKHAQSDRVKVNKSSCDFCTEAFYHSEHCKKLDKDHAHKCRHNKNLENSNIKSGIKSNILNLEDSRPTPPMRGKKLNLDP